MPAAQILVSAASLLPRRRGALIFAYHDITLELLRSHTRLVAAAFHIVTMGEIVTRLVAGRSLEGLAAFTFDDGWRSFAAAATWFQANRWPVLCYLPTRILEQDGGPLWFAELEELAQQPGFGRVAYRGCELDGRTGRRLRRSVEVLAESLCHVPADEACELVRGLARCAGVRLSGARRFLDAEFVARHASDPWVRFGSHGVSHQSLASLDDAAAEAELAMSRSRLEALLTYPVEHYCYPYGGDAHLGPAARARVGRCYASAVTMRRGVVVPGTDPLVLPRIPIYARDHAARLALKIATAPWR